MCVFLGVEENGEGRGFVVRCMWLFEGFYVVYGVDVFYVVLEFRGRSRL